MRVAMSLMLVAMLASFAFAQDEEFSGLQKGMTEITATGSYMFGQGDADDTWVLALGYGQMFTENIQFAGRVVGTDDLLFLLPSVTYYFASPDATAIPYVAADLGYAFVDSAIGDDDVAWGGRAGVKMFTSSQRAWFAEFQYLDYGADDAQESINLGMSQWF